MKSFHFLFVILFSTITIKATELISLGGRCTPAGMMRNLGLRKNAYPFDWMFSKFDALYKTIDDNFEKFLDPATLQVAQDNRIVINSYGLEFVHDFPTIYSSASLNDSETHGWATIRDDWRQFIQPIGEKYNRRIERFKQILTSQEQIFLIRYGLNKNEAIKLRDLLKLRYPSAQFTLIAVNGSNDTETDWGFSDIKNFNIIPSGEAFFFGWKRIYKSLGINLNIRRQPIFDTLYDSDECTCDGSCHSYFLK